jgi:hypothetical protein
MAIKKPAVKNKEPAVKKKEPAVKAKKPREVVPFAIVKKRKK